MNKRRGHESNAHLAAKERIGGFFGDPRWAVMYEYKFADLVIFDTQTCSAVAVEIESTPRNVIKNVKRDLSNGCVCIAVIVRDARYIYQIREKIRSHVSSTEQLKIEVFRGGGGLKSQITGWVKERCDLCNGVSLIRQDD